MKGQLSYQKRSLVSGDCDWSMTICLLSASDLIINVEVPLALILAHHPRLLQQEVWDFATVWLSSSAELNLKVFPLVDAK